MASAGTFRSLRQPNARLFFAGMLVSNVGTWMQATAQGWLVFRLSGEGTSLGLVLACQFVPLLVLGPWAGVIADRTNRRRLTIATQTAMAVQALLLGVLDLSGLISLPLVYGFAVVLGVLSAIDNPARRGLVTELVDEDDIPNALSLNTAVMTGARVFGPALAAVLVELIGTGWCFIGNGLSFLAVLGGLLAMDARALRSPLPAAKGGRPVREGLSFIWGDRLMRDTFIVLIVVSTFGFNYNVSLLLLSSRHLGGGAGAFGLLLSVTSVGSVIGSLIVASRHRVGPRITVVMLAVLGAFSVLLALAASLGVALLLAVPVGLGGAGYVAATNSIILPRTPPGMRGRVLALQSTAFLGSTTIGGPITGWIGDRLGASWSIAYGGLIAMACALAIAVVMGTRSYGHAATPLPAAIPAPAVVTALDAVTPTVP